VLISGAQNNIDYSIDPERQKNSTQKFEINIMGNIVQRFIDSVTMQLIRRN